MLHGFHNKVRLIFAWLRNQIIFTGNYLTSLSNQTIVTVVYACKYVQDRLIYLNVQISFFSVIFWS